MERQPADRPPRLRKAPCSNLHERPAAKDIALDTCHVDTRRNEAGRGYRETLRHQHQRDWDACTTLREPSWHRRMNKPADMPLQNAHRTCQEKEHGLARYDKVRALSESSTSCARLPQYIYPAVKCPYIVLALPLDR